MDCIFCKEKGTVEVILRAVWGTKLYHAVCNLCGAQGQSHKTAEAATQEWQRLAGYKKALYDILHGPIGITDLKQYIHSLEQTAHDALYGPDDTEHVGNWTAWMEREFVKAVTDPEIGNIIEVGKE